MPEAPQIGPALRSARAERGWTLDRLATESGVSTSMLSEIERGESNPTFATLWNITQSLDIEIQDLMLRTDAAATDPMIEVVSSALTPTMASTDGRVRLRALSPPSTADDVEWYVLDFDPGGILASSAHPVGTAEHLTVLNGQLHVANAGTEEKLDVGATARYRGDLAHSIENRDPKASASALLVVLGGQR